MSRLIPSLPEDAFEASRLLGSGSLQPVRRHRSHVNPRPDRLPSFDIDLAALSVSALNLETYESRTVRVGHDGSFAFPGLAAGNYELTLDGAVATAPHVTVAVASGERAAVTVPIVPGGGIMGTVQSTLGMPLADVAVTVHSTALDLTYTTYTGEDGSFVLTDVYPGSYDVAVEGGVYVDLTPTIDVDQGQVVEVSYDLVRGATLSGTVTDQDTASRSQRSRSGRGTPTQPICCWRQPASTALTSCPAWRWGLGSDVCPTPTTLTPSQCR